MKDKIERALIAWRLRLSGPSCEITWYVMNRFAPDTLKHAALLLGFDYADGYGRAGGLLCHLSEFGHGLVLGNLVRAGGGAQICAALEEYRLERSAFRVVPEPDPGGSR